MQASLAPFVPALLAALLCVGGCASGPPSSSGGTVSGQGAGEAFLQVADQEQLAYGPVGLFTSAAMQLKLSGFEVPGGSVRELGANRWAVPAGPVRFKASLVTPGSDEASRFPVTLRFTARDGEYYLVTLDESRNYRVLNMGTNKVVATAHNPAPWVAPESE